MTWQDYQYRVLYRANDEHADEQTETTLTISAPNSWKRMEQYAIALRRLQLAMPHGTVELIAEEEWEQQQHSE
jgi:hypothetical protein